MTANKSPEKQGGSGPICTLCGLPCSEPAHLLKPKPLPSMQEFYTKLNDADLETVISFFDCDRLRHHFTSLIAEMRAELHRRQELPK